MNIRKTIKRALPLGFATGLFFTSSAMASILFQDDFSDGNYTSNPAWIISGDGSWSVVDGAVKNGGLVANDYLQTKDFAAITNGEFSVSIDVRFTSTTVAGDNRIYLRMRDSTNGWAGYEVAIAQGTMQNTLIQGISTATVGTQTKTTTPQTFSTSAYTTITWTRTADGVMIVSVAGKEYLRVASSSISNFDTFQIGGRGLLTNGATSYTYSFDNITISSIPEPKTAALLIGALGLLAMYARSEQR